VSFPLAKATAYAELRKPFLVNDIRSQNLMLDRRLVYMVTPATVALSPA
jgi:hypothetical protein